MSTVYGQTPHFDNSTPDFDPVGETYNYWADFPPTIYSGGKAISYGSSTGNGRSNFCLRRYVYEYVSVANNFNYYKTYKGVRNFKQPDSVIDIAELNSRSLVYSTEITTESEPAFITQSILRSLFSFPSNSNYFFIEGSHSKLRMDMNTGNMRTAPNYFKIYRYGKITQNNVIITYKNNTIERRQSNM